MTTMGVYVPDLLLGQVYLLQFQHIIYQLVKLPSTCPLVIQLHSMEYIVNMSLHEDDNQMLTKVALLLYNT
jgi:hypothetical protein